MKRPIGPRNWLFAMGCLLALSGPGCGGGSIGTGTEPRTKTTFSGSVTSERGEPVAGAVLRLLNTNEAATSAADGTFTLASSINGGTAMFEITAGAVQGSVDVPDLPVNGAAVNLDVTVDFTQKTVSLRDLSVTAKIEGVCDPFFENSRTIRQSGRVPDGTRCPLRVRTRGSRGPVSGLLFLLQNRRCPEGSPWHESGRGTTGNIAPGLGELIFPYSNNEQHCVYRILAPVGAEGAGVQEFIVNTFRKQAFDGGEPFDPNAGDGQ